MFFVDDSFSIVMLLSQRALRSPFPLFAPVLFRAARIMIDNAPRYHRWLILYSRCCMMDHDNAGGASNRTSAVCNSSSFIDEINKKPFLKI